MSSVTAVDTAPLLRARTGPASPQLALAVRCHRTGLAVVPGGLPAGHLRARCSSAGGRTSSRAARWSRGSRSATSFWPRPSRIRRAPRPRHGVQRPGPPGQGQDPPGDQDQRRRHAADQGRRQPDAGQRRGLARPGARHGPAARALGGPAADLVHHGCVAQARALPAQHAPRLPRRRQRPRGRGEEDDTDPDPPDVAADLLGRSRPSESATTPTQSRRRSRSGFAGRSTRVLTPLAARLATRFGFVALASARAAAPDDHRRVRRDDQQRVRVRGPCPTGTTRPQANLLDPYLYWKLDETGATVASQTAADASGNGRTGQYNGNLVPNVTATYFTRGVTVR